MRVYQRTQDLKWILIYGPGDSLKATFDTQGEAINMSKKVEFVTHLQAEITSLAKVVDAVDALGEVYTDRGYQAGGGDAITTVDVEGMGLTAEQVYAMVTALQQFLRYATNLAVTTGDYRLTFNQTRTDI